MPITPVTTTSKLNEQTGLVLAYYGYDQSKVPPAELKAVLDNGWMSIDFGSSRRYGAVVSILTFVVNPAAGVISLLTQQEIAQHGKYAIEQAMYGLAANQPIYRQVA